MSLKVFEKYYKYLLVVFGAVVILSRAPDLFLYPRFWAEEGSLYYLYAYEEGFFRAIFFIPESIGGYFSLIANFSAALASLVPIKHAPKVTTFIAFVFFLLPIILITNLKSPLWDSKRKQILLTIIYLFSPIHTEEATLNTINLMSHLGICALLILFSENSSKIKNLFSYFLLALAGLSGVYAVFLAPIFFLKTLFKRNNYNLKLLGVITFVSLIQVAVFLSVYLGGTLTSKKLSGFGPGKKIASTALFHTIEPIFSPINTQFFSLKLNLFEILNSTKEFNSNCIFICCLFVAFTGIIFTFNKNKEIKLLWLSFLIVSFLSNLGAMDGVGGGRYAMVAGFCLTLFIFSSFFNTINKKSGNKIFRYGISFICLGLLANAVFWGIKYQRNRIFYSYGNGSRFWIDEINTWQKDEQYELHIFPYPRWNFVLSNKNSSNGFDQALNTIRKEINDDSKLSASIKIEKIPSRSRILLKLDKNQCNKIEQISLKLHNKNIQNSLSYLKKDNLCEEMEFIIVPKIKSAWSFTQIDLTISSKEKLSAPINSIKVRSTRKSVIF